MHLSFHWMRNRITTKLHSFPKTVKFYLNTLLLHNNCSHRITKCMAFIIKDKCPCSRTTHSLFSHSPTLALYQFNFVVTVALFFSHRANERCGKNHGNCKFLLLPSRSVRPALLPKLTALPSARAWILSRPKPP